ncbi:hypothetical protein PSM36_1380 [Proteiniphilum saccharofermentans]|uniref:DUF3575 domain-containing protein n=2 Tax=Proteiniphilum saccharofermentans TaxID=1642647 RepID=A0A1R3T2D8_9BACT|nr:hypothetical protein PSM36_1380 [Proteiniphilum saccharofermentans]
MILRHIYSHMRYLKRTFFIFILCISLSAHTQAQKTIAVKTNIPYWATASPNLGVEVAFRHKMTFELSGGYNPFEFGNDKQWKHWIIWPEARYWLNETFNGHSIGLHGVFAGFDVGGLELPFNLVPELKNRRVEGNINGIGLSYGYAWIIGNSLLLEVSAGAGYGRLKYDVFTNGDNGYKTDYGQKHYIGPTKGAISLVYLF